MRAFNVSLINIPLFLNRFGDVVPEGRMYVLDENIAEARATFADAADPFDQEDIIEPLVLRVNLGDCVEVDFTNRLDEPAPAFDRDDSIFLLPGETLKPAGTVTPDPREFAPADSQPHNDFEHNNAPDASIHFDGLDYDVNGSDGAAVGFNDNSTVAAGQSTTYRLYADIEGEWQFKDGADFSSIQTGAGNFIGSHAFGAFGGIVVEPPDATWVDSRTGDPIDSGARAIIRVPGAPDFREHVLFMHDEVEAEPGILTRFCVPGGGWNGSEGDGAKDDNGDSVVGGTGDSCIRPPNQAQIDLLTEGTIDALSGGDADALVNGEIPVKLEWFAFNYRSEPGFNREEVHCAEGVLDQLDDMPVAECIGEETSLSSWTYGDPGGGDLVFSNYRGEPTQVRLFHPAELETHTFHWHVNRWPLDPDDEGGIEEISKPTHHTEVTNILDVQAVTPGDSYSLIVQGGAGSAHDDKPATFGDIIFHCHLYPHFANGMWGLNRTFDRLEDGNRANPDGTPIPPLEPVDDFDYQPDDPGIDPPPSPNAATPGFPHFVPGTFGLKAPKPPLGVAARERAGDFPPTQLEIDASDLDEPDQVPGGFFQDACPPLRSDGQPTPVKTFYVEAIELEQTYNPELEWKNPQSRIYVGGTTPQELQDAKTAVLTGGEKPEPFAPLLTVGDCVIYHLTNSLPLEFGDTVFDRDQITNEVSIHQHMVQFDVLSSDGAANGWNYDQGADASGTYPVTTNHTTITYRNFVHEDTSTNSFHDHFFPNVHQDSGLFGGASIHPAGCEFYDPYDGTLTNRVSVNIATTADIICTQANDYHGTPSDPEDYRNFSLFIEDHAPMFQPDDPTTAVDNAFLTPHGVPIFPAKFPSSPDDSGAMGINYRLEPFENRRDADPRWLFSSGPAHHGDPFTPPLRVINGDRTKIRLFQLSQEESHGFNLERFDWKSEPRDPDSRRSQSRHIGMLEYFDLHVDFGVEQGGPDPQGNTWFDLLYNYGAADDWFLGTWGVLSVALCNAGFTSDGRPVPHRLPDNPPSDPCDLEPYDDVPCPHDNGQILVPIREFDITALNVPITYNRSGDHDPNGLTYALTEDVPAIVSGTKPPEPLIIRVNKGDCIEVTFRNQLDPELMMPHCHESTEPGQLGFKEGVLEFPDCIDDEPNNERNVPGFEPFPVSAWAGIQATHVEYHRESVGSDVGLNVFVTSGTVPPGSQKFYRWYAAEEVGLAILHDRADVQNHLHHGLYGGLIIEPEGSTYLDPATGGELKSGAEAVIVNPNGADFREIVLLFNSDLALFKSNDDPVPDNLKLDLSASDNADDPEDTGQVSVNYANEPWANRFQGEFQLSSSLAQDLSLIFSSLVHGDPATPVFGAYAGDPVRFRVAQAVGKPRSTGFGLHGHRWRRSPDDPESDVAAFQGQFNPMVTHNVHLEPTLFGGAGGPREAPGDYLYRTGTLQRHMIGGQWGIFRVHDSLQAGITELPDRQ